MMNVGQAGVGPFFAAMAQGFVQTRFEDILFFALIVAFVVTIVWLLTVQKRREDREIAARVQKLASLRRRRYVRKKMRLPVRVARESFAAARETTLLDLGAGGASFRNPWETLRRGEKIRLSLGELSIPAGVVRVSKRATVIHVRFEALAQDARNRLLTLIREARPPSPEFLGNGDGGDGPVRGGGGDLPVGL